MSMLFGTPSSQRRRTKYRSSRSVQPNVPTHIISSWTRMKITLVSIGACFLACTTIFPIYLLEQSSSNGQFKAPVSLHNLVEKSKELEHEYKERGMSALKEDIEGL